MKEEKKNLIEIIQKNPDGITPEILFKESNYTENKVDKFYMELKSIEKEIVEIKQIATRKLWPKILIKPKKV